MTKIDYWQETIEIAADEIGLELTPEQAKHIAGAVESSHDNIGLAFYSPPSSDIRLREEREWEAEYNKLKDEFESFVKDATEAVRKKFRVHPEEGVSIGKGGAVFSHGGRTNQLQ